jgi:1-acyl-sn-glycerol-3-phosphate acyltransferase
MLYATLKPLTALGARLLFRLRAEGAEHVPAEGAVLIASNHASLLDPPLVGVSTTRELTFLAKAELFDIPLFGGVIWRLNARPVRREGSDPAALRTALRVLGEGRALLIFPEGTRSRDGQLGPGKPGAGMLAVLSGAPVVPTYISGSGRAWPRGQRLPHRGHITVYFGPAFRMARGEGHGRKGQYEAAARLMMAAIARVREHALGGAAASRGAPPQEVEAVGSVEVASSPRAPKFIDGRNGRHGER